VCSGRSFCLGSFGKLKVGGLGELGTEDGCSNANVACEVRRIRLPDARPQLEDCPACVLSPIPLPVDFVCKDRDENDMTDASPV
jgi:hypothetical protein